MGEGKLFVFHLKNPNSNAYCK